MKEDDRIQRVNSLILNSDEFLVVVDGGSFDSLAAGSALVVLLKSLDKKVTFYSPNPAEPANLSLLKGAEGLVSQLEDQSNKLLISFDCPLENIEKVSSGDEGEKLNLTVEFRNGSKAIDPSKVEVRAGGKTYPAGFIIGCNLDNENQLTGKGRWAWISQTGAVKPWAEVNLIERKATLSESVTSLVSGGSFEIPLEAALNLYWGIKKGTNDFETADSIALQTAAYCLQVKEAAEKKGAQPEGVASQTSPEGIEAKEGGAAPSEWQRPPIFTGKTTPKV